jgi:GT2 family glycosyltransferase
MAVHVSVVIPAYNAAGTIRAALDSVAAQTFRDFEVIVVDDNSVDGTAEVVRSCWGGAEDSRRRLIRLDCNLGPAGARNAGMREARGEWIAFLDGDDAWLPWRLSAQMACVAACPDAALVCGEVVLREAAGQAAPSLPANWTPGADTVTETSLEDFVDSNPVPTSTVLARKDVLRRVGGFDEQFRGPEDIDLWMRVAASGRVLKIRAPLAAYREAPGSLSMTPATFLPEILRVYAKAFGPGGALHPLRRLRRRAVAGRYVSAAWTHLACRERGRALALLLRSWLIWPRRLRIEESRPLWRLIMLGKILLNVK